jgi:hypothetical protein
VQTGGLSHSISLAHFPGFPNHFVGLDFVENYEWSAGACSRFSFGATISALASRKQAESRPLKSITYELFFPDFFENPF